MTKQKKVPNINKKVSGKKEPIIRENPESYFSKNPSWRFSRWDSSFPHEMDLTEDLRSMLSKLQDYERMTWSEICKASGGKRKGSNSHHIDVADLTKKAQDRLSELRIENSELFSLRLQGRHRVFGILEGGILTIIWNDLNHEVCESTKINT